MFDLPFILKLNLLVLFLLPYSHCHWLCDLSGVACSAPTGSERARLFSPHGGYLSHAQVLKVPSELGCALHCNYRNCALFLVDDGEKVDIINLERYVI